MVIFALRINDAPFDDIPHRVHAGGAHNSALQAQMPAPNAPTGFIPAERMILRDDPLLPQSLLFASGCEESHVA
jgi:hypothetical protein